MGSLRDLMRNSGKTLSEKQASAVIGSIVHGLVYLHQINLIHRDIKSANILLGPSADVAKLSDFGLADFTTNQLSGSLSGSAPFLAPEVVKERKYSVKSDIYSLGVTLIELLENTAPFDKLSRPKKYSADLNDFVSQCLAANPDKRPTATQLQQHAFLAKAPAPSAELFKDLIDAAKKSKTKRGGMTPSASSGSIGPAGVNSGGSGAREITSGSSIGSGSNERTSSASLASAAAVEELKTENTRLAVKIEEQDSEINQLKEHNLALEARLAALERHLGLALQTQPEQLVVEDGLVTHPVETLETVETLHPTDLLHSSDSMLHVGLLPSQ